MSSSCEWSQSPECPTWSPVSIGHQLVLTAPPIKQVTFLFLFYRWENREQHCSWVTHSVHLGRKSRGWVQTQTVHWLTEPSQPQQDHPHYDLTAWWRVQERRTPTSAGISLWAESFQRTSPFQHNPNQVLPRSGEALKFKWGCTCTWIF